MKTGRTVFLKENRARGRLSTGERFLREAPENRARGELEGETEDVFFKEKTGSNWRERSRRKTEHLKPSVLEYVPINK